jgi:hypothetical protein
MYNKDTDSISTTSVSSVKSSVLLDDSLNDLIRVEARFNDMGFSDVVSGKIKPVDIRTLHSIERNYFEPNSFSETEEYIVFKYPFKPTIYVKKKDGLTYAHINTWETRKQAWHLLRILGKFGYVENFKRTQYRKNVRV